MDCKKKLFSYRVHLFFVRNLLNSNLLNSSGNPTNFRTDVKQYITVVDGANKMNMLFYLFP